MRKHRFITTLITALSVAGSGIITSAAGFVYQPVNGSVVYVENYLVMDSAATVPNVTFNLAIEAGSSQGASGTNSEVFSGNDSSVVSGTPAAGSAVFTKTLSTYTEPQAIESTGTQAKSGKVDPVVLQSGQKYARAKASLDFSSVQFKEPGIYRWVVTESNTVSVSPSNAKTGIVTDTDRTRVIDVYVETSGTDGRALAVAGYVLHNNESNAAVPKAYSQDEPSTKTNGFINQYVTNDLTIAELVTGNQASRDEYFEVNIEITGGIAGTESNIDLTNADAVTIITGTNTSQHTNPSKITFDENGTARATFWIQGDQSVKIQGLTNEVSYSVTENDSVLDEKGYSTTVEATGDTTVTVNGRRLSDTALTADTTVTYTNERLGTIPTGVLTTVLPGLIVICSSLIVIALKVTARKREADRM